VSNTNDGQDDGTGVVLAAQGADVVIPLQVRISVSVGTASVAQGTVQPPPRPAEGTAALEKLQQPITDPDYDNRKGYDETFLGPRVPLPEITTPSVLSRMDNGEHVIPYEHFSVVMNKKRRLAIFTASNVDGRAPRRRPEPGDYSRRGLTGLGPNDQEKWLTDPRIPEKHQLPDEFYTRDGGAYDKGHIVRREDVCWGDSRDEVVRANGDTFHTTNCSPQVADFNRSNLGGSWGNLENFISEQAKTDRFTLFAGPVLLSGDPVFVGREKRGEVRVQIPRSYWKVVVALHGNTLQAFGFRLEQDLTQVPIEEKFQLSAVWKPFLIPLEQLERLLGNVRFPPALMEADQAEASLGEELVRATGVSRAPRS
jgi:endonuclease G, mitochondrial